MLRISGCLLLVLSPTLSAAQCPSFDLQALAALGVVEQQQQLAEVEWTLHAGLLQPQLEALLREHFKIQQVFWQVSPHFQWPADYRLSAPSWTELLDRLLKPYRLTVTLFPNHAAEVRYLDAGARS